MRAGDIPVAKMLWFDLHKGAQHGYLAPAMPEPCIPRADNAEEVVVLVE
jgi:hypothetical protein